MKKKLGFQFAAYVFSVVMLAGCSTTNTVVDNGVNNTVVEDINTEVTTSTPVVVVEEKPVKTVEEKVVEEPKKEIVKEPEPVKESEEKKEEVNTVIEAVIKEETDSDNIDKEETDTFSSIEAIKEACEGRATCQDSREYCIVEMEKAHNPYDVEWDYGEKWNAYVDACDWSLVFDAEYYKKAFPMLAILYNNDDELLLEHFATVGVHEGRQGSKDFNVEAYLNNCDYDIYKAFKGDVEGAYIYYMLHYDTEKNVDTLKKLDGSKPRTQLFVILTAAQEYELNKINALRKDIGENELTITSELCAFANYRAYLNRINHSGYGEGHNWAKEHNDLMFEYLGLTESSGNKIFENTITSHNRMYSTDLVQEYYDSKSHRDAMLHPDVTLIGSSNYYLTASDNTGSHFDLFTY